MSDLLERRLVALSGRLDVDVGDRLVDDVMARVDTSTSRPSSPVRGRRRVVWAAVAVAAAVLLTVVVLPGPRHAVARWFGIGSTRVERTPPTTMPPPTSAGGVPAPTTPPVTFPIELPLGEPVTADAAAAATGLGVPAAPTLGDPQGIYVVHPPDDGQIVVVYPPSEALPATRVGGVGALLSAVPGTVEPASFLKAAASGTEVVQFKFVAADGSVIDAVWLGGEPHQYSFVDAHGTVVWDTLRLATNTLLWQDHGVTYRFESDLDREEAVRVAQSVTIAS